MNERFVQLIGSATIWVGVIAVLGYGIILALEIWWSIYKTIIGIPKLTKAVRQMKLDSKPKSTEPGEAKDE